MAGYITRLIVTGTAATSLFASSGCYMPNGRPVWNGTPDAHVLIQEVPPLETAVEKAFKQNGPQKITPPYAQGTTQPDPFDPVKEREMKMAALKLETIQSSNDPRVQRIVELIEQRNYQRARLQYGMIKDQLTPSLEAYLGRLGGPSLR